MKDEDRYENTEEEEPCVFEATEACDYCKIPCLNAIPGADEQF